MKLLKTMIISAMFFTSLLVSAEVKTKVWNPEELSRLNCDGYSEINDAEIVGTGGMMSSPHKRCLEVKAGKNSHGFGALGDNFEVVNFNDLHPDGRFKLYESIAAIDSRELGYYNAVIDYGVRYTLIAIEKFLKSKNLSEYYPQVKYHLENTPYGVMAKIAKNSNYYGEFKEFL